MPARDAAAEVASIARVVEATWRIEAAKIVATLTRYVGDFGLAEDLAQDALAAAMSEWPRSGVPAYPAAWLTTTAKRRVKKSTFLRDPGSRPSTLATVVLSQREVRR